MSKPDYAVQSGEPMDRVDFFGWVIARYEEAKEAGCTYLRGAQNAEHPDLFLIEGWKSQPLDDPEPFFFLQAGEDDHSSA